MISSASCARRLGAALSLVVLVLAGCGNGGGDAADAAAADAAADAGADAAVDAGPCGGGLLFTGEYLDWDSAPGTFLGVHEADVAEVGNEPGGVRTSPNGRAILCLVAAADTLVRFSHDDYLPVLYSVSADAAAEVEFSVRGLTPARAAALFAELSAPAVDEEAAQVLVEVRTADGQPALGAQVALGAGHDGAFTAGEQGAYEAGDTLAHGPHVLFANAAVGAGTTTLTVTPPAGSACTARAELALEAGSLASTLVVCD